MKPKLGDVFEYVEGSCFLIGLENSVWRLSFNHEWELNPTELLEFTEKEFLFNLFDVLGKTLGGKYAK